MPVLPLAAPLPGGGVASLEPPLSPAAKKRKVDRAPEAGAAGGGARLTVAVPQSPSRGGRAGGQPSPKGDGHPPPKAKAAPSPVCDKCDGRHASALCPHYRKARDRHPDAQPGGAKRRLGADARPILLRRGRVVPQPGDGSCLFHSLRYGLHALPPALRRCASVPSAPALRQQLARWVASNAQLRIADTPVSMWVKWDSGLSAQAYASRMARSGWGGGVEMAACSHLMGVSVWVYERRRSGYERISCFDAPRAPGGGKRGTLHILYRGGVHYDAFLPDNAELHAALAAADARSPPKASGPLGSPASSRLPASPAGAAAAKPQRWQGSPQQWGQQRHGQGRGQGSPQRQPWGGGRGKGSGGRKRSRGNRRR